MNVKQLDDVTNVCNRIYNFRSGSGEHIKLQVFFFFLPLLLVSPEEQMFCILWCLIVYNHNIIMQWLNDLNFISIK